MSNSTVIGDIGEDVVAQYWINKNCEVQKLGDNPFYRKYGIDMMCVDKSTGEEFGIEVKSSFHTFERYKLEGRAQFWFIWDTEYSKNRRALGTLFRSKAKWFIWCTETNLYIFDRVVLWERMLELAMNPIPRGLRWKLDESQSKITRTMQVNEQVLVDLYVKVPHNEQLLRLFSEKFNQFDSQRSRNTNVR